MKLFKVLYPYRFHIFLSTQLMVIFGGLLIPIPELENILLTVFLIGNLIGGLTIIYKRKRVLYTVLFLILLELVLAFGSYDDVALSRGRTALFLFLFAFLFVEIIIQIISEKKVNTKVIIGMFSGYITLAFIGLFLLQLIILADPDALLINTSAAIDLSPDASELMYYSFITLLSIGYGDIIPVSPPAQKTAILLGLSGQFYLTVVIAMIVGKYLRDK